MADDKQGRDEQAHNADRRQRERLQAVDTLDDDEGVRTITDWIVTWIDQKGDFPKSRTVRRRGAKIARVSGSVIRNDEWLGV